MNLYGAHGDLSTVSPCACVHIHIYKGARTSLAPRQFHEFYIFRPILTVASQKRKKKNGAAECSTVTAGDPL